jgi:hypothetical protein
MVKAIPEKKINMTYRWQHRYRLRRQSRAKSMQSSMGGKLWLSQHINTIGLTDRTIGQNKK